MKNFYILLIIFSGAYLAVQTVAWLFFSRRFFPDAGELFENKQDKDIWQTVFPKNMLRLIIVIFVGSVTGLLTDAAGLDGWITMPVGAMAGIVVNFIISTVWVPIYDKHHQSAEPTDDELEGLSARVTEEIDKENFGVISVKHGYKSYLMRAITANGRTLKKGTNVIVIYAQDGCCFVESEEHFFDILFEDEENKTDKEEEKEEAADEEDKQNKRDRLVIGEEKTKNPKKKSKKQRMDELKKKNM